MFGLNSNKSKWQELANSCTDYKLKSAINDLFIPYKISLLKFLINQDCFSQRYSYSYTYEQGATFSMIHWAEHVDMWNLPLGFPEWFYYAFPDVAYWASEDQKALTILKQMFEGLDDDDLNDSDCRLKISILKKVIDAYINTTHKRLEVVDL